MSEPNFSDILSGGGLSSLLQNPEVAAKLPRIMEALGPVMAEMRAEEKETLKEETEEKVESQSAVSTKVSSASSTRRLALLKALEPYLSQNRREAMEFIMKVTSLIDLLSEVM